jgi:tetratricopeptide (TPR) repeat protein
MTGQIRHRAVRGGRRADRQRVISGLDLPPVLMPVVDAHSRLRGPYTAGAPVIRTLAADVLASRPELARRHDIEILALAPEAGDTIPVRRERLFNQVPRADRTRIHSRFRTLRIAHGLADFVRDAAAADGPRSLVVENLQDADPTDAELFAVLLRRIDPATLTLVLCAGTAPLHRDLDAALRRYASITEAGEGPAGGETRARATGPAFPALESDASLAAAYVASDGTSDDPAMVAAYQRTAAKERARLHDARADELERGGGRTGGGALPGASLGAIPYHRERGSDPAGAGAAAVKLALDHCYGMAFHHASACLGRRGRALAHPGDPDGLWWAFARKEAMSLALLGRAGDAERLYDEARATSADPAVHHPAAYATAMLYARYHEPGRLDYVKARAWANQSLAIASLLTDHGERAFHMLFYRNGLALAEMRLGHPAEALRLVDESLSQLDRELPPGSRPLDRCSLLSNRARVLAMLGRPYEAADTYDTLVALDSSYGEYHFDRGNFRHGAGWDTAALADYDAAISLSLPFAEVHYNRAQLRSARGDAGGALADLDRVLELDPAFTDAYVNRAGLLAAAGEHDRARADVDSGLALDPGNPHLTSVLGQIEMAAGRLEEAATAFSIAIDRDPGLAAAWAGRAAVWYERGDPDAAVADLTRALEAGEDAPVLFNRAVAFRAAGRTAEAAADAARALQLAPTDPDAQRLLAEIGGPAGDQP